MAAWTHHRERRGDGEYRLDLGPLLAIIVHRHIHAPDRWHVSCHRLSVERVLLQASTPGDACEEAHRHCVAVVQSLHAALGMRDPSKLADDVRAESALKGKE